jgi:hypothetical protein
MCLQLIAVAGARICLSHIDHGSEGRLLPCDSPTREITESETPRGTRSRSIRKTTALLTKLCAVNRCWCVYVR